MVQMEFFIVTHTIWVSTKNTSMSSVTLFSTEELIFFTKLRISLQNTPNYPKLDVSKQVNSISDK